MHRDLERLWALGGIRDGVDPPGGTPLAGVGLIPCIPLERMAGYPCTPLNSTTFARTGGDGVHFGLLHLDDRPIDEAPVVLTTPVADKPNVVVGETLREFLALGCRLGYHALAVLAFHDGVEQFLSLRPRDYRVGRRDAQFLRLITQELGLVPWQDVPSRLAELQERYLGEVHWPPPLEFCKTHGMQNARSVCLHFPEIVTGATETGLLWRHSDACHLDAWCRDCDRHVDATGALASGTGYSSLCEICFAEAKARLARH